MPVPEPLSKLEPELVLTLRRIPNTFTLALTVTANRTVIFHDPGVKGFEIILRETTANIMRKFPMTPITDPQFLIHTTFQQGESRTYVIELESIFGCIEHKRRGYEVSVRETVFDIETSIVL